MPGSMPYQTEMAQISDLGGDDIIIAFMGPTGSGKSQIIDTLTGIGDSSKRAEEGLKSATQKLEAIRVLDHEKHESRIVLVDTPGFDNSNITDEQILKLIGEWLENTYKERILLSGIVYVQPIAPQMSATLLSDFCIFAELTGLENAKNVVLTTTMWDMFGHTDAASKWEQRWRDDPWNDMIDNGAAVERLPFNNSDSTWSIVDKIVNKSHQKPVLLFQQEMVDRRKPLEATCAGKALRQKLDRATMQGKKRCIRVDHVVDHVLLTQNQSQTKPCFDSKFTVCPTIATFFCKNRMDWGMWGDNEWVLCQEWGAWDVVPSVHK